jgi:putative ABC transport system permease protein
VDRPGSPPVAVISQSFARRYFPGREPVGRRLTLEGRSREIVGVVADVVQTRIPGREGPAPILYLPQGQTGARDLYLFLRTPAAPAGLANPIRDAVAQLDRSLPVAGVATLERRIQEELVGARTIAAILASFGVVALLLAALGIYGVIAYSVQQQTHEIGVRLAIGAQRGAVLAQVARQGLVLTGLGFLLGLPLVYLAVRSIAAALAGAVPFGATTVPAVALLLGGVAAFATLLPAQRAAQIDPAIALRYE